jgi:beta-galactosidase
VGPPSATPHSFNDVDSFRKLISHSGGDTRHLQGPLLVPQALQAARRACRQSVFLEFEGMRQAGDIYLNGKQVGLYENGVTAYGIDITDALRPTARRTSSR